MEKRMADLRVRLNKILLRDLMTREAVSKAIGIHPVTFDDFFYDKRNTSFLVANKVERFLNERESDGK
jgi:hypothetical protein